MADLPPEWTTALDRAAAPDVRRIAVVGPTDVGKSSFIHMLAERRPGIRLIDLDPGQKMVGAPGTASLGSLMPEPRLDRFVFLGSTAVGSFGALAEAASYLAAGAEPFVANTSGYVAGAGARLQAMTLAALRPDLIVAIDPPADLEPALALAPALVRLARSPLATRKTPSMRARLRQQTFAAALAGAVEWTIAGARFEPAPPILPNVEDRPVCALADEAGEDVAFAILLSAGAEGAQLLAAAPPGSARTIRLGRMWARPSAEGWRLLERLSPAWAEAA